MQEDREYYKWVEIVSLVLSICVFLYLIFLAITGVLWGTTSESLIAMTIPLLSAVIIASSSIILTNSVILFCQTRQLRSFVILFMALDIVLLIMTYLITHPVFEGWLPLADRNRNRTLILAMGFTIFPSMLVGAFAGSMRVNIRNIIYVILWTGVIIPGLCFWFLFSPDPVFVVTSEAGGLSGLTPLALIMVITIALTMFASLVKYAYDWYKTRERVVMAMCLALVFWLYGEIIIVLLEDPTQLAEIVWLGSFSTGFVLIAFAMLVSAVLEPRKILEETVEARTSELSASKAEGEFYLGMWTHKMGNFLQAMYVYLDLLSEHSLLTPKQAEIGHSARELSREATLMNLQVTKLLQVIRDSSEVGGSRPLAQVISDAMDLTSSLLNPQEFKAHLNVVDNPQVSNTDLIPVAILSIISYIVKNRCADNLSFMLECQITEDEVHLLISWNGKQVMHQVQEFVAAEFVQFSSQIDFDIFVARSLIDSSFARLFYSYNDSKSNNEFTIILPLSKNV